MGSNHTVLGLVGSPNREGRTNQLVLAALAGAEKGGAAVEKIQMADYVVSACKDSLPWVCKDNLKCSYEDEAFEHLRQKIFDCGALVLGTPVYWWDTSGLIKYLILKMFRIFAWSAPLHGLPAAGIAIAGGTGNGLVSGLRPIYHFFQIMQMRALDPLPATRFNFNAALAQAAKRGEEIAAMAKQRQPFVNLEERLLWYDALPYLALSRAGERRLLADLTAQALPPGVDHDIVLGLARSDELTASGKPLEGLIETTQVYTETVKTFEMLETTKT